MFHPDGPSFWELARQALSSTERGYDLLAPKFDVTPFRTPPEILEGTARHLERGPRPELALDLCCGTGAVLEVLAPLAKRAIGLDFSRGMLVVAAERFGDDVGLVRADALAPPFAGAFDLVTCFSALGHFLPREHERLVASVRQCLRPGGRFVFQTARMPSMASTGYWRARGFNAAMRVRNLLFRPPFVMYYLTFLLPEAGALLEKYGFEVTVFEGAFGAPFDRYLLVEARLSRKMEGTSVPAAPTPPRRSGR